MPANNEAQKLTMIVSRRLNYYRRIARAYLTSTPSHLTFWHERPEATPGASGTKLGPYYMTFRSKADYDAHLDEHGVPLLHYQGAIGLQYNPIAIAQYGLGNYNVYCESADPLRLQRALGVADWLVANLESNKAGLAVWNHHFDWEYRDRLRAPWYSALAQGQGISLLVRAHAATGEDRYLAAAFKAFEPMLADMSQGGVQYRDSDDDIWLEEYVVEPPTHILNGFMWASWGLRDLYLATADHRAAQLEAECITTLKHNLGRYDCGFWSLYELSGTALPMLASPFYHALHIVQLEVMYMLTGETAFALLAQRWSDYHRRRLNRSRAVVQKSIFKLCYY